MKNDVISRSEVLAVGNVRKVVEYDEAGYSMEYNAVPLDVIEDLPALDVAPVVHARWIPDCETVGDDYFGYDEEWFVRCSRCGRIERDVDAYPLMDGDIRAVKQDYPYCHCGARMDGDPHDGR